jgi:hypothetical protein
LIEKFILLNVNWDAIGAIASAVATIAALLTIVISIRWNKETDKENQYSVQPWFHATSIGRMGGNAPIKIIIINDASPTIKIDQVTLILKESDEIIDLDFKYLKKGEQYNATGKCFGIEIKQNVSLFGRVAKIEIHFTNLYQKSMKAVSPDFRFNDRESMDSLLFIESEGFLYIPFNNFVK